MSTASAPTASAVSPQLSLLVVDDDADICEYLSDLLTQAGHRVRTLTKPEGVIEALKDDNFHVCILDLMMPNVSGLDLLEQIRKVDDDMAVIILTGNPSMESMKRAIHHEVSAYIGKPFTLEEFRAEIERIAKKKGLVLRREDELYQTIGRTIRDLRQASGLTLKQMARRTDLSVSLLSQIERSESQPSLSSLLRVANALDVRVTELFGAF